MYLKHNMVDHELIKKICHSLKDRPKTLPELQVLFYKYSSYSVDKTVGQMWHSGLITNQGNWLARYVGVANRGYDRTCRYELTLSGLRECR